MTKKIVTVVVSIVLMLLPFYPIMENFFPVVDNTNFVLYSFCCFVVFLLAVVLAKIVYKITPWGLKSKNLLWSASLLFVTGFTAMFALHLGAPKTDAGLLDFLLIERVRYGMLLLSVLFFAAAWFLLIRPFVTQYPVSIALFISFLSITFIINIWDNFSSFMLGSHLTTWVDSGKNSTDFFLLLDHHMYWRIFARISLYVVTAWGCILLVKNNIVRVWQTVLLVLFCLTGISFCVVFLLKGFAYYFPFMIPAIALAPAYWTGIALLNRLVLKTKEI